jgi:ParB family chromosome partitioning protein
MRTTIDLALVGSRPSTRETVGVRAEARRSVHPVKVAWLPVGEIDETPPELNSRRAYDETSIDELAASVAEHGILQPLCVRPTGARYVLVFGMRRLRAAARAGLREVPCTIQVADEDRAFLLNTVENLHRRQLSGAERVRAIEKLAATDLGVRDISRRTGFHPATISRWLKIDRRPLVKDALEREILDLGRAMALADAPEEAIAALLQAAPTLRQDELKARVAQARVLRYATPRSVDSRRLLEALRLLTLVQTVGDDDVELLGQLQDCLDRLHARAPGGRNRA